MTPTEATVSRDIIEALRQIEKEKGIAFDALVEALEDALLSAYKKTLNAVEHAKVEIDTETCDMRVYELIFPDHIDVEALKVHDDETGEGWCAVARSGEVPPSAARAPYPNST